MKGRIPRRLGPALGFVAAGASVYLGMVVSPWFWLFLPAGVAVLGMARRFALLRDHDEFRLAAENEAGWYAFLTAIVLGGLFYCLERGGVNLGPAAADRLLVTAEAAAAVYGAVYLFRFHDGRLAARILLFTIGGGLALFVVLSCWGNPISLLIEAAVVVLPFAGLGLLSGRFPRTTALFCFATGMVAAIFFNALDLQRASSYFVLALICLPLTAAGIGLLVKRIKKEESE